MSQAAASQSNASTGRPIRCVVIQLARLGDTIQSLMALRAAKQLYPQLEIHLVVRDKFSSAAKRVPWIESVTTLPTDELLENGVPAVARWIAPLVQKPFDLVVNWSFSEPSSWLTSLIPAKIKLGYSRRRDTSFQALDGWSHYVQGVVQSSTHQNIHLTDILTTQLLTALQIHFGEPAEDGNSPVTSKSFFQIENGRASPSWRDHSRKWIAVQLGAAQESKAWSPECWADLAALILKRHPGYGFVLLGGEEDIARSRAFMAATAELGLEPTSFLSLVGQSEFDLWATVIGDCQWLLSGDTAAIHLASVLGTRVLNVSVGPVRWRETGPYGNGHYVVTATDEALAADETASPSPEAAYAAWSYATAEWSHQRKVTLLEFARKIGFAEAASQARILRSRIRATTDGGGVFYEPQIDTTLRINDWSSMVMGHLARAWYCGWVPKLGQELTRSQISPALIKQLRELDESTKVLSKIYGEALLTSMQLEKKTDKLRSRKLLDLADKQELQDFTTRLSDLDALVERLGRAQPVLAVFSQMGRVCMHSLAGGDIFSLGRESTDTYRQLQEGVTLLNDWIKHSLGLVRPMAVVTPIAEAPRGTDA